MKAKNQRIWSNDHDLLKRLADEQENYIGRPYRLDLSKGLLTIYALPPKPKKRAEKRQRRNER